MSEQLQRRQIADQIFFNVVSDQRFKSNRISVNLVLPLERDRVTVNALVPFLLRKGCRECPDFTKLNQKLCLLYGASLDGDVSKYGGVQILNLSIQSLDNRFAIDGEDVSAQCADLLANLLLDPHFVDGAFDPKDTELEKKVLLDTIQSEINEKRTYAVSQCVQEMFRGEPFAVKKYGYEQDVPDITPQSAARAYRDALERARIEILFVGCGDGSGAQEVFARRFAGWKRSALPDQTYPVRTQAGPLREKVEEMEVSQGKLVMGFRLGELKGEAEVDAMKMMIALFGGTPFSKLFVNVREKYSLCYYCAARMDRSTGSMLVDSGVEVPNRDKAQQAILHELEEIRSGSFTDEDLEAAKLVMQNALQSAGDSLYTLESWYLTQILSGLEQSPSEAALALAKVTREEIVQAARQVALDTVYFLKGTVKEPDGSAPQASAGAGEEAVQQ